MGSSSRVTVGYWYRLALHFGLCRYADALLEMRVADRAAWRGELSASGTLAIDEPELLGGESVEGGIVGDLGVLFGEQAQTLDAYLAERFGADQSAYRGKVTAVWKGGRWGAMNPYPKAAAFKLRRTRVNDDAGDEWYPEKAAIAQGVCADAIEVTQVFSYTGSNQNFVVPAGVTSITVKAWAGGGGGGTDAASGGGAGFSIATIAVMPGETLGVGVGGGGEGNDGSPGNAAGGWGHGLTSGGPSPVSSGDPYTSGGGGGGASLVHRSGTQLIVAGGGGGGGGGGTSENGFGGPGGGVTGGDGGNVTGGTAATGGTASAGGEGGVAPGLGGGVGADGDAGANVGAGGGGGNNTGGAGGGGGGGGYHGGGGGGTTNLMAQGGGGGSGYAPGGTTTAGVGQLPAGTADADYVDGVGVGGNPGVAGGDGLVVIVAVAAVDLVSANPAHILYHTIVDGDMLAEPSAGVDEASFIAAADTLYDEGFGLCTKFDPTAETIEDFQQRVCNVIAGSLSRDRRTGLWTLDLMRGVADIEALPVLTDDDILDFAREPGTLDDAVNQVTVKWRDPCRKEDRSTAPLQALGLIQQLGGVVSETLTYSEIPAEDLALRVGARELRQRATPLARLELKTNRKPYAWRAGTYFRLQAPKRGIADMVCLVGEIDVGTLSKGAISLTAVQDVFSMPSAVYVVGQEPPSTVLLAPTAPEHQRLIEAPYIELARALTTAELAALAGEAGFVAAMASAPTRGWNYTLQTAAEGEPLEDRAAGDWTPVCLASAAAGMFDTVVAIESASGLSGLALPVAALWDEEIVRVDAIDLDAGELTLGRGCADTVPAEHDADSVIYLFGATASSDEREYVDGETVTARILSRYLGQRLSTGLTLSVEMDTRAARPYPPADLKVNGQALPTALSGELEVSWAHRDRLQQADLLLDTTEASIGPEDGATVSLRLTRTDTEAVLYEVAGLVSINHVFTPDYSGQVRLEAWAVRMAAGGFDLWSAFEVTRFGDGAYIAWRQSLAGGHYIDLAHFQTLSSFGFQLRKYDAGGNLLGQAFVADYVYSMAYDETTGVIAAAVREPVASSDSMVMLIHAANSIVSGAGLVGPSGSGAPVELLATAAIEPMSVAAAGGSVFVRSYDGADLHKFDAVTGASEASRSEGIGHFGGGQLWADETYLGAVDAPSTVLFFSQADLTDDGSFATSETIRNLILAGGEVATIEDEGSGYRLHRYSKAGAALGSQPFNATGVATFDAQLFGRYAGVSGPQPQVYDTENGWAPMTAPSGVGALDSWQRQVRVFEYGLGAVLLDAEGEPLLDAEGDLIQED